MSVIDPRIPAEWAYALHKASFPLWSKWWSQQDWHCEQNLSVQGDLLIQSHMSIGNKWNIQYPLYVQGTSCFDGDIYITGKVFVKNTGQPQAQTPSISQTDTDTNDWLSTDMELPDSKNTSCWETIQSSYASWLQMHPTEEKGIYGVQSTTDSLSITMHIPSQEVRIIGSGTSGIHPPCSFHVPHIYTQQVHTEEVKSSPHTNMLSIGKENDVYMNDVNTFYAPTLCNFDLIKNTVWNIPEKRELRIHGDVIFDNVMEIKSEEKKLNMLCSKMQIDEFMTNSFTAHTCHVLDHLYVDKNILVQNDLFFKKTLRFQPSQQNMPWIDLPHTVKNVVVRNMNAELWSGRIAPPEEDGDFLMAFKKQPLKNKYLGGTLDAQNQRIIHVPPPLKKDDVATKEYVDKKTRPWMKAPTCTTVCSIEQCKLWGGTYDLETESWTGTFNKDAPDVKENERILLYSSTDENAHFAQGIGIFQVFMQDEYKHGIGTRFFHWKRITFEADNVCFIPIQNTKHAQGGCWMYQPLANGYIQIEELFMIKK